MAAGLSSLQIQPSLQSPMFHFPPKLNQSHKQSTTLKSHKSDNGIPSDQVKTLAKFKSRHNFIRVLEVSRKSDHPFAGSRLLLLDKPGNIHSISFLLKLLTGTYFDVFATFPPILPPGPLGILGFGAGSAAKLILELYPQGVIHGWELDPAVVSVAREYFGLSKLERQYRDRLIIHIGNALNANVDSGFAGLLVDVFSNGCLIPELQDPDTWNKMKRKLREGGRIMVNVGGSCVEPEDSRRDGRVIVLETLKAMEMVFPGEVSVLSLGRNKDDSSIAVTGKLPDLDLWKSNVAKSLRFYVDMWKPFSE
ncbi:uncharacterized protein LOC143592018 [Bidens hawaiensis]|uniref:uncharacterized protein LOC143592018 n=1 Tax=Bidens hawaiensis TaxID=980011 RepID=UPI00404B42F7